MKEQLITFETAKLAKEKGLNVECLFAYDKYEKLLMSDIDWCDLELIKNSDIDAATNPDWRLIHGCTAPTQSLLQKWLREEHCIDIFAHIILEQKPIKKRQYSCYFAVNAVPKFYRIPNVCDTFEEALEQGLITALKHIK